jgi:hypothetical protein
VSWRATRKTINPVKTPPKSEHQEYAIPYIAVKQPAWPEMIIKPRESKSTDIATLKELLETPGLDSKAQYQITQELRNMVAGDRGENEAQ